ncbi:MAG TPA: P-II family nitrogen regulator [Clostridia bacterium]|jgi:nitrogen regulatory protein PII|nr:P-II family nitrogen regulator [Clostridia bacterium]
MGAYSLLIAIVRKGFCEKVMIAAHAAGARGGTLIHGRGTGSLDASKIWGVTIEPEKDIILILTEKSARQEIMKAIYKEAGLTTEGNGIVISLPVEDVIGIANITKEIVEE